MCLFTWNANQETFHFYGHHGENDINTDVVTDPDVSDAVTNLGVLVVLQSVHFEQ